MTTSSGLNVARRCRAIYQTVRNAAAAARFRTPSADFSGQAPTNYETVNNLSIAMAVRDMLTARLSQDVREADFGSPAAGYKARLQYRLTD